MNKADKAHLGDLFELGCIVCLREMQVYTPPQMHHIRADLGMGQRNNHRMVLPLCFEHHSAQGSDGFHAGKRTWQAAHGTETELLEDTKRRLGAI